MRLQAGLSVGLLLLGGPAIAGPAGAIFTTDAAGTFVNGNVYEHPGDVYLNGGPKANAPCDAAGLPDGEYYFQVTDPSGQDLLSTDPIGERAVRVDGGLISAYLGGTHAIGTSTKCGATTVQLCPFLPSPNEGDEYKVWMTPVLAYDARGGFSRSDSKTDNFKVSGTELCGGGPD
jgi:hypothetical protein